jgi:hypothetical protein
VVPSHVLSSSVVCGESFLALVFLSLWTRKRVRLVFLVEMLLRLYFRVESTHAVELLSARTGKPKFLVAYASMTLS